MEEANFRIQREALARYMEVCVLIIGVLVPGWILLRLGLRRALEGWSDSLEYRLEGDNLSVKGNFAFWGFVLYRKENRIPLARITDLKLVQGPILHRMNLWKLYIQTAGSGTQLPEAVLYGLEDPHGARDAILRAISAARSG